MVNLSYHWVPHACIQPRADRKYLEKEAYVVADMHCVVRPKRINVQSFS